MWNDEYYDEDFSGDYNYYRETETPSRPTILYPIF